MKLEELAKLEHHEFQLMLLTLPYNKEYQINIERGLPFFTAEALDELEKDKQKKLTYEEISDILSRKGMIIKLPTFKKYINLDLISPSVGRVKKRSVGLYSPRVIREINFIKYALFSNLDLKTFFDEYGTNAFNIITSAMGSGFFLWDYKVAWDENGEFYPDKIKRMLSMFFEKKIITSKEKNEVTKIADRINDLHGETLDLIFELEEILKKINVPNPLAFLKLDSLKA